MLIKNPPLSKKQPTADPLAAFLGADFRDPQAFIQAKNEVKKHCYERERLAKILLDYNKSIGNDEIALQNALKIAQKDSYCVVTGQQLGFMSGPSYMILKGISCLLVAKETGAIPIFWLATEDHDIPEIDHTYLIDSQGNLKSFRLSLPRDGTPVEDIKLSRKNIEELKSFWDYLELALPLPIEGDLYSTAMVKVLVHLFAGTGMVFLEPKLLRPLSTSFFLREINEYQSIQDILKTTTDHLKEAGGHPLINVGQATNLFLKNKDGKRLKLKMDGKIFEAGIEKYDLERLLEKVKNEPEMFSTNVAARPVLQNTLLPVIAYIAGPAELAYHHQLADYHKFHHATMPCLIPRLSATFIPPYILTILEACELNPWDKIPHHWPDIMPALQQGEEELMQEWLKTAKRLFEKDFSPITIERYVRLGGKKLIHKVCKARLHQKGLPSNGLHLLRHWIRPHHNSQERLLNWWGFQAKSQENLIQECLKTLSWDSSSHYYLYL